MLTLPDVTLVCVYNVAPELHTMAAVECLIHAEFGDVRKFFLSPDTDYTRFVHYELHAEITTSHLLMIQWDSWIINPYAWRPEFLDYDYIGAPWWYNDKYNVGNSGFCLISKRLMEFLAEHEEGFPVVEPYDHVLCREYQKRLPQFKWAPQELAWRFSIERTAIYPTTQVFGFHGLFNFPDVLSSEALAERLALASKEPWITSKPEWRELQQRLAYAQNHQCPEGPVSAA
jgi:hypothetical protein